MLISTRVQTALADAGVMVLAVGAEHVELRHEGRRAMMRLHVSPRPLNPSDITSLADRHRGFGLLIVPAATPAARRAAEKAGWSWVVDSGPRVLGILRIESHWIEVDAGGAPAGADQPERARPGRVPWGTLTLLRRLLEQSSATQQELAAGAGISQPRVSQALASLAEQGLVERTAGGWRARDFDQLLRWWLRAYRGPGGISTFWYGLDQPRQQAQAVLQLLAREAAARPGVQGDKPLAVLSGDVAADFLAPWRTPVRAVVYARTGADLTEAGLTPAGEEEATLELVVPRDPGVWGSPSTTGSGSDTENATAPLDGVAPPLADPLQILWDLQRSPGSDTDEAVARLCQELRDRSQARHEGRER